MLDSTPPLPDLRLLVGPGDHAALLGACAHTDALGRAATCLVYVAVHRRAEVWTHVYRVVPDRRPGHLMVYIEKALAGDAITAATAWARERFGLNSPA